MKHGMAPGQLRCVGQEGAPGADGALRVIQSGGVYYVYTGQEAVRIALDAEVALAPVAEMLGDEDRLSEGVSGKEYVARFGLAGGGGEA